MSRFTKKKQEDIGLSPYAMVFRGQKKTDSTNLRVIDFNMDEVQEYKVDRTEELTLTNKSKNLRWLNVDGLHHLETMENLTQYFEIPKHIMSDVMNPSLRPKVQEFDTGIFVTIKILKYSETDHHLSIENLSLLILDNVLISFQEQPGSIFEPIRERIRKHRNKIRNSGSDYLAFALLDVVVDNYIYIIGILGDKIEDTEEAMTIQPNKYLLDEINNIKVELNFLRKNIKPAKEMILALSRYDTHLIHKNNRFYFKELQDNINEANELSDSYREIIYDQITIYHTIMSTKLNDIMRTLTVISVIFIPLTFIVGVYGTNFHFLPELNWHYGYYIMWAVMLLIVVIMLWFFRRKKWF
jgi:magnesium transporter